MEKPTVVLAAVVIAILVVAAIFVAISLSEKSETSTIPSKEWSERSSDDCDEPRVVEIEDSECDDSSDSEDSECDDYIHSISTSPRSDFTSPH